MSSNPVDTLIVSAKELGETTGQLVFSAPVAFVYNPLDYAWAGHEEYLQKFGRGEKRVIFVGMNPGPFGMMQTGVPFGEIAAVRDWMGIRVPIKSPKHFHPKRAVEGFDCQRSEVSGRRLWGLFAQRFGSAEAFFKDHFVVNYCPLAFLEEGGRNLTPDKLPNSETSPLFAACDKHLRQIIQSLRPEWVVGVGDFARDRALRLMEPASFKVGKVLHPSPASPAANRDWSGAATRQLEALGIW